MDKLADISSILAIRLSGIGDVVLLLPALAGLKASFDGASVTLITGSQCAPVAQLCPYIDRVIPVDRRALSQEPKLRAAGEIYRLVREVRGSRFDLVVDFHSLRETNLLAWLSGASYRIGLQRSERPYLGFCFNLDPAVQDNTLHISEMFGRVAENVPGCERAALTNGPMIEAPPAAKSIAARLRPRGPTIALNVGASRASRRWPASRFAAVAVDAVTNLGASVLVLAGASEEEEALAREVLAGTGNLEGVHLANGLSFSEVVAVIGSVDLLVSNDTGPMHIGPALGVPTIGIFSGGSPRHYRPAGPLDRYAAGESMDRIETEQVIEAMQAVWQQIDPDRRP